MKRKLFLDLYYTIIHIHVNVQLYVRSINKYTCTCTQCTCILSRIVSCTQTQYHTHTHTCTHVHCTIQRYTVYIKKGFRFCSTHIQCTCTCRLAHEGHYGKAIESLKSVGVASPDNDAAVLDIVNCILDIIFPSLPLTPHHLLVLM